MKKIYIMEAIKYDCEDNEYNEFHCCFTDIDKAQDYLDNLFYTTGEKYEISEVEINNFNNGYGKVIKTIKQSKRKDKIK